MPRTRRGRLPDCSRYDVDVEEVAEALNRAAALVVEGWR
ncbi:hypothetical protein AS9A_0250 [Hoyosella subflava DQS3-9A1]|uniref:Uncharacterized protein n=1 Tax=Hoyosella subflava (strain DSM 45089 / JCM 17490 / NBRC 109087 / DQS3-9A1) TaxID=443218 RepID=F6EG08_HOYSD|nr:hypothetical protein AS9A_0250 [Hoyosella subflava DQS3-9A1]